MYQTTSDISQPSEPIRPRLQVSRPSNPVGIVNLSSGRAEAGHMLSLDQASAMVDAVLGHGRTLDCAPLTVAVLDQGGHLLVLKRQDGCGILRPKIAQAKAWGALGMGVGSRALAEDAAGAPAFYAALASIADGQMAPIPGGVLVRNRWGDVVAAIGVSGDNPANDESCAVFGIETVGFTADPGEDSDQF
ncbi:GlcG/HbpS family heme-binding protein [Pseudonocardia spinosispora]|uniref:GlcG/HbpS family heme-binding protein n=1 Tax=Pseudonocardia spinosispora TaxID=103441 RepID=UPI00041FDFBF|nr:heme-binding protein [Pseudonocardia spinosispora]